MYMNNIKMHGTEPTVIMRRKQWKESFYTWFDSWYHRSTNT